MQLKLPSYHTCAQYFISDFFCVNFSFLIVLYMMHVNDDNDCV